jgi:hypothetical protein
VSEQAILTALAEIAKGAQSMNKGFSLWLDAAEEAMAVAEYEMTVAVGQQLRESGDGGRFVVGYALVGLVGQERYGGRQKVLDDYCRDTGYTSSQVREYLDTASFWPVHTVRALMKDHPTLTWSHFNRARRGLEMADAQEIIERAGEENWSLSRMEAAANEKKGARDKTKTDEEKLRSDVAHAIRALKALYGRGLPAPVGEKIIECVNALEDEA